MIDRSPPQLLYVIYILTGRPLGFNSIILLVSISVFVFVSTTWNDYYLLNQLVFIHALFSSRIESPIENYSTTIAITTTRVNMKMMFPIPSRGPSWLGLTTTTTTLKRISRLSSLTIHLNPNLSLKVAKLTIHGGDRTPPAYNQVCIIFFFPIQ